VLRHDGGVTDAYLWLSNLDTFHLLECFV
jgi:hypothetical protein